MNLNMNWELDDIREFLFTLVTVTIWEDVPIFGDGYLSISR